MALSRDTECQVVSPLQRKVDVETASRLRLRWEAAEIRTGIEDSTDVGRAGGRHCR